ncbi:MAG: hypothetical protein WAV07_15900 [Candidatus Contendobacter sp.]
MGAEERIGLQLAGIEFLPPDLFLDKTESIRHLLEAADSGQFDPAQLPFPKLPIRQVFADQQGDHYLVVPTNGDSPLALPYITGSEVNIQEDMRQGGFVPVDALAKVPPPSPSSSSFPDPAALIGQLTTGIVESVAKDGSISDALLGQFQSQLTGLALSQVPEEFRGIAGQVLNQALKKGPELLNGLMSGDLGGVMKNPFDNVGIGDVGSMAVGGLMDMGFSALTDTWKVDDNSSTFEQVAHKYGMQALGMIKGYIIQQMQSFLTNAVKGQLSNAMGNLSNGFGNNLASLGKQFDLFFNGMSSGAILPAAHIASKDDKVDVVITGFPTVLVEGKAISRITDLLDPSKKIILEGAATVFAGKMPVGRVTSDTAIPSDLLTGATTVLIGGPSVKISPPIAPKSGAGGGAGNGQSARDGSSKRDSGDSDDGSGEGGGKKGGDYDGKEKKTDRLADVGANGSDSSHNQQSGNDGDSDSGEKKELPSKEELAAYEKRRMEISQESQRNDLTEDERDTLLDELNELDKKYGEYIPDETDKVLGSLASVSSSSIIGIASNPSLSGLITSVGSAIASEGASSLMDNELAGAAITVIVGGTGVVNLASIPISSGLGYIYSHGGLVQTYNQATQEWNRTTESVGQVVDQATQEWNRFTNSTGQLFDQALNYFS